MAGADARTEFRRAAAEVVLGRRPIEEMPAVATEALSQGISTEYVQRLLADFPIDERQPAALQPQAADAGLVEPLSQRETEVLHLIAEGWTNQEIAEKLYLSLRTVKGHARNIYGKLGVKNRTKAVARGKVLGILPAD